jgi:PEGA domain
VFAIIAEVLSQEHNTQFLVFPAVSISNRNSGGFPQRLPFHARQGHHYPRGHGNRPYVNGDMKLDIARFQPAPNGQIVTSIALPATNSSSAKLQLESNPPGADIELDGDFVGNTPSEVQVIEGNHTVTVKKMGFKDWERKMKVNAGSNVHLNAELEKAAAQ